MRTKRTTDDNLALTVGFKGRLYDLRKARGLRQAKLAQLSGVAPSALSQLESGARLPAIQTLIALARALETTTDHLLGIGPDGEPARSPAGERPVPHG